MLALVVALQGCADDQTATPLPPGTDASTGTPSTGTPATLGGADTSVTGEGVSTGLEGSTSSSTAVDATSGSTTDGESSTGQELCEAPVAVVPCDGFGDAPTPLQAIGLDCPGGPDQAIALVSSTFQSADADAWQIGTQLGSHVDAMGMPTWGPTHGDQLLMISSGFIAPPDATGRVLMATLEQDANDNPDDKPLPAPMVPAPGSGGTPFMGCNGVADCSDSLWDQWLAGGSAANDLLWFQLRAEVPGGTHGFAFDLAFFSEEFPESVGTTFNDMFVVWSSSETYVGNLCFVDEQPCTVTALWPVPYEGVAPQLQDTGFGEHALGEGGGTGWFRLKGSAAPHEMLELTLALFDMGDDQLDTLVLLDGFGWDCQGCTPTPEDPCGVVEPR
ncbi:choice-of-anchor L domain-containing protein [Paraliomyxa miuraensis]|uniref:choice-of-anchor L domain-containing protein n=1 Tax=Paraliomyxa miuraensis TaxID=376150 RepID=UPI0022519C9E|nr:choice-of-anchor L domain-containing protein [Paraliomyxa miuraensis]MCX4241426.1 choice-of-anchor L domain-containing protein [Paraliomyxa miuraensis]